MKRTIALVAIAPLTVPAVCIGSGPLGVGVGAQSSSDVPAKNDVVESYREFTASHLNGL